MDRKNTSNWFRLGINKPWLGRWYAEGKEYTEQLHQDLKLRKLIMKIPSALAFPLLSRTLPRQGEGCLHTANLVFDRSQRRER